MSVQIFLQGKLIGIEPFLLAPAADGSPAGERLVVGRAHWITLLSEVLPRALLSRLGLAKVLLGTSGGGGFLLVLPRESLDAARSFCNKADSQIRRMSGQTLRLATAWTENLGDWTTVRRRLSTEMWRTRNTDPSAALAFHAPFTEIAAGNDDYFTAYLTERFREAQTCGWSAEEPARILLGEGSLQWAIRSGTDAIPIARHTALNEEGTAPADTVTLASRAQGRPVWGVLRADVDGFAVRARQLLTVEEHVQLSVLFKQFFAGELELGCSLGEYWRKVTILYSGGDDFAVYGAWDALLLLARELERLFRLFSETNLKDFPGPEGKTITMALALAPDADTPFAPVYREAGRGLETAKSADRDCFHVFGRTIEWRHLAHSSGLKDNMLRMVSEFGCPPEFLEELGGFYHEKPAGRTDRPWRYHRRLALVLGPHKDRELLRLRTALITDIIGKSPSQVRLRPAGRVALEWARLLMESQLDEVR